MSQEIHQVAYQLRLQRDASLQDLYHTIQELKDLRAQMEITYHILLEEGIDMSHQFQSVNNRIFHLESSYQTLSHEGINP